MTMKTRGKPKLIACLLLALLALMVLALSSLAVWMGDDVYFTFSYAGTDWLNKISSLKEIFDSQCAYYMGRNGRFVTHCVVQFFCGMAGKGAFAVCNALMWPLFVVMLTRVAGFEWRRHVGALFMLLALSFVCLRTQFTPPCQVNYIWAFTAGLFAIDLFLNPRQGKLWAVFMVVFGFLAGWGQESFSSGVSAAMWIYALLHFKKMKPSQWGMLVAFTAGMLCLCLAPGNFSKLGANSLRATPVAMAYYMRAIYLLAVVVLVLVLSKKASLREIYKENTFWFNAMFFMVVFNFIARVYCNRQLFGIEVMSIIIVVRLLYRHVGEKRSLLAAFMGVLLVLVGVVFVTDLNIINRRVALAKEIKALYEQSNDGIVYCDIPNKDFYYRDEDPMWSFNYWALLQMSRVCQADGGKPLEWRPAEVKALLDKPLESQAMELGSEPGTLLLIYADGDSTCAFKVTQERRYGPVFVAGSVSLHEAKKLDAPDGTNVIRGDHFRATVYRHNDVYDRYTDAQLVRQ